MQPNRVMVITICLWLLVLCGVAYWRLFFAWHMGELLHFIALDLPLLFLMLILLLGCEYFYFRRS